MPTSVLIDASRKSREFENAMKKKKAQRDAYNKLQELLAKLQEQPEDQAILSELTKLQEYVQHELVDEEMMVE